MTVVLDSKSINADHSRILYQGQLLLMYVRLQAFLPPRTSRAVVTGRLQNELQWMQICTPTAAIMPTASLCYVMR